MSDEVPGLQATDATKEAPKGSEHLFMPGPDLQEDALAAAEAALLESVNGKHKSGNTDHLFVAKDPFAPPGAEPELAAQVVAPAAPATPPAAAPAPAPTADVITTMATMMAKMAEMDKELSAARAATKVPVKTRTSFTVDELRRDPVTFMKEAGLDMEEMAQHMVAAQLGNQAPAEIRLKTAQSKQVGDLRAMFSQQIQALQQQLDQRDAQERSRDYEKSLETHLTGVKTEEYPTIGKALAADRTQVLSDLIEVAREDARARVAAGETGMPIDATEAAKRLEVRYARQAKLFGSSATNSSQVAVTAEPKSVPRPATMTALGGTPPQVSVGKTLAEEDAELRKSIKLKHGIL